MAGRGLYFYAEFAGCLSYTEGEALAGCGKFGSLSVLFSFRKAQRRKCVGASLNRTWGVGRSREEGERNGRVIMQSIEKVLWSTAGA